MLEQLIQFDINSFYAINRGLANPFFDWLMPILRNRFFWTPLYLFMAVFFVRNYRKQGWMILVFLGITFGLADYISSSVVKPAVERLRPCNNLQLNPEGRVIIACGTGYSFPSSHATNHFAIAVFLSCMFFYRWKAILPLSLIWATSIGFAQIYVGVHFPLDILAGALLGALIGSLMSAILLLSPYFKLWKPSN